MNKGDVILIVILAATAAFFGADLWLVTNGFEQWAAGAWTCFAVVFGGELLSFALYRIGKAYGQKTYLPKGKHAVEQLEAERKDKEDEGKATE